MIIVLLDTNIILDFLLERKPFIEQSEKILQLSFDNKIKAYISATTITDIYYIIQKEIDKETAKNFISEVLKFIDIASVDKLVIEEALNSSLDDFEDAVQENTALHHNFNYIITRNIHDYKTSKIKALTPSKFYNEVDIA